MIEEFPFTTRVLQAELDANSLYKFLQEATKDVKNRLAKLTWARLTWEQRVTLHPTISVLTDTMAESSICYYQTTKIFKLFRRPIVCETLSQMQFGTLACGNQERRINQR